MKSEGSSSSSHAVADTFKQRSEMMLDEQTKKCKKTTFLDGMDAFDDFLQLVAPQRSNSKLLVALQMEEGFVVDDDDTSFLSDDDSEDESSKNLRSRVIPERGVRRDHSGDLERLFQARHTITDKIGRDSPRQDKKQVIRGTIDGSSKQSKSMNNKEKPTVRGTSSSAGGGDQLTNAAPEQRRRTSSSTNLNDADRAAPGLSKHDNKAARILSRHSAHELGKSDQRTTERRRGRRLTPPTSSMQQQAKDVQMMADPICSVLQDMSRTECRGSSLRRSRGDLSSSEHSSRPRLRRDALYAAKRLSHSSGTSDIDRIRIPRPSSEIDFQKAAATAAKKRQSAGTTRRISGGTNASSPPRGISSKESLRYSTANFNSSAELSDLSPPRLPRSNTTGTSLCRSTGPKRSLNNLKLDGVYSNTRSSSISPKRTVEDVRRSLKKNGGRNDIDDLVVKMTTRGALLPATTTSGNATWN